MTKLLCLGIPQFRFWNYCEICRSNVINRGFFVNPCRPALDSRRFVQHLHHPGRYFVILRHGGKGTADTLLKLAARGIQCWPLAFAFRSRSGTDCISFGVCYWVLQMFKALYRQPALYEPFADIHDTLGEEVVSRGAHGAEL